MKSPRARQHRGDPGCADVSPLPLSLSASVVLFEMWVVSELSGASGVVSDVVRPSGTP